MVRDGGAEPRILLTKTDLVAADELAARIAEIRNAGIDAPVLALSNLTETGIDELKQSLLPAKTYCFVGGSGVGKSTLINRLLGNERLATGTVSGTGEGRHTTVRRELIVMEGGALLIDNPGMREFGVIGESGVDDAFSDIAALVSQCRYRDCTHENEPGCAIREALETGQLEEAHYKSYMKLKAEAAFHQMSYVEKRHKDRDFGRFIKKVKKHLRND
jgi:ribosome biogenesis GTPase